jgi:hypothetical protein
MDKADDGAGGIVGTSELQPVRKAAVSKGSRARIGESCFMIREERFWRGHRYKEVLVAGLGLRGGDWCFFWAKPEGSSAAGLSVAKQDSG